MRYLVQIGRVRTMIDNSVTAAKEARTFAKTLSSEGNSNDIAYIYQELAPSVEGGFQAAGSRWRAYEAYRAGRKHLCAYADYPAPIV